MGFSSVAEKLMKRQSTAEQVHAGFQFIFDEHHPFKDSGWLEQKIHGEFITNSPVVQVNGDKEIYLQERSKNVDFEHHIDRCSFSVFVKVGNDQFEEYASVSFVRQSCVTGVTVERSVLEVGDLTYHPEEGYDSQSQGNTDEELLQILGEASNALA